MLNFATPGTGEITTEERFQHQHQRKPFASLQALLQDIGPNYQCLA
jgi:hypothetical protein